MKLQKFLAKDYLGIEFWKKKDSGFGIRTTEGATEGIKSYSEVTKEQHEELRPYIEKWYSALRKHK